MFFSYHTFCTYSNNSICGFLFWLDFWHKFYLIIFIQKSMRWKKFNLFSLFCYFVTIILENKREKKNICVHGTLIRSEWKKYDVCKFFLSGEAIHSIRTIHLCYKTYKINVCYGFAFAPRTCVLLLCFNYTFSHVFGSLFRYSSNKVELILYSCLNIIFIR